MSGIIILITEKSSLYVMAWALQSIFVSAITTVIVVILCIIFWSIVCSPCQWAVWVLLILYFILWLFMFFKALTGVKTGDASDFFRLPLIGDFCWRRAEIRLANLQAPPETEQPV